MFRRESLGTSSFFSLPCLGPGTSIWLHTIPSPPHLGQIPLEPFFFFGFYHSLWLEKPKTKFRYHLDLLPPYFTLCALCCVLSFFRKLSLLLAGNLKPKSGAEVTPLSPAVICMLEECQLSRIASLSFF